MVLRLQRARARRGFTLIELLIVVAIIGILSSVILVSLNAARTKGDDAAVKSSLAQIRPQAATVLLVQGCYGDNDGSKVCADRNTSNQTCNNAMNAGNTIFNEPRVEQLIRDAIASGGGISACRETGGGSEWAISVQLSTDDRKAWCVDSFGTSRMLSLNNSNQNAIDMSVNDASHNGTGGSTKCNPNY